jgi:hypothetical protein
MVNVRPEFGYSRPGYAGDTFGSSSCHGSRHRAGFGEVQVRTQTEHFIASPSITCHTADVSLQCRSWRSIWLCLSGWSCCRLSLACTSIAYPQGWGMCLGTRYYKLEHENHANTHLACAEQGGVGVALCIFGMRLMLINSHLAGNCSKHSKVLTFMLIYFLGKQLTRTKLANVTMTTTEFLGRCFLQKMAYAEPAVSPSGGITGRSKKHARQARQWNKKFRMNLGAWAPPS